MLFVTLIGIRLWLFKHKFNEDGSLSRYKARLVANGRSQQQGIDCDETFSRTVNNRGLIVMRPLVGSSNRLLFVLFVLAVIRDWHIHPLSM
ncbi:ribonuclease H-like domain-containing protein [Tanacetum coccineum]